MEMNNVEKGILQGLEEAVAYTKGQMTLKTTRVTVADIKIFNAEDIRQLRLRLKIGQRTFADILGVSPKTVEAWESGKNIPSGPSSRLIELLNTDPAMLQKAGLYEYITA
ncbi:hypothetical protein FACS1894211_11570 [Clostridia bacterium]|nr:hypothetical protein FACS1894211_11570 [Clostridia bacterium]